MNTTINRQSALNSLRDALDDLRDYEDWEGMSIISHALKRLKVLSGSFDNFPTYYEEVHEDLLSNHPCKEAHYLASWAFHQSGVSFTELEKVNRISESTLRHRAKRIEDMTEIRGEDARLVRKRIKDGVIYVINREARR